MNKPIGLQTEHREEQHACMKEEGQRGWYCGSQGGENEQLTVFSGKDAT